MRVRAKFGIDILVISLMVSLTSPAKHAVDRPQTPMQRAIQTFVAPNNPGADIASTLIVWAADSKTKNSNKGRRGNSSAAKEKSRKKTKTAGQRANTDNIGKYLA